MDSCVCAALAARDFDAAAVHISYGQRTEAGERRAFLGICDRLGIHDRLIVRNEALRAIARQAMARKVGARGLRMILEELMLDLMFNLPSQKKLKEFEVTREMVEKRSASFTPVMEKAG